VTDDTQTDRPHYRECVSIGEIASTRAIAPNKISTVVLGSFDWAVKQNSVWGAGIRMIISSCRIRSVTNVIQLPTLPISRSLVNMTTIVELCSHSMRQKSSVVSGSGACVAMYALRSR